MKMLGHSPKNNSGLPTGQSPQSQQEETNTNTPSDICFICNQRMNEKIECLIIVRCNHAYHRACIENSLSKSNICPICNASCELSDLQKISFPLKQGKLKGRPRGGHAKQYYQTRSLNKSLFQDPQTSLVNLSTTETQETSENTSVRSDLVTIGNETTGLSEDTQKTQICQQLFHLL